MHTETTDMGLVVSTCNHRAHTRDFPLDSPPLAGTFPRQYCTPVVPCTLITGMQRLPWQLPASNVTKKSHLQLEKERALE